MRTETERPEAVRAGTARIVGVETAAIIEETERFLKDHEAYEMVARAVNPYGDGHAAKRIAETLLHFRAKSRPVAVGSILSGCCRGSTD